MMKTRSRIAVSVLFPQLPSGVDIVGVFGVVSALTAAACGSEAPLTESRGSDEEAESVEVDSGANADPQLSAALGNGELDQLTAVELYRAPEEMFCSGGVCTTGIPVDLGFNPARPGELWVVFRQPPRVGDCELEETGDKSGCAYLYGKVAIISDADSDQPRIEVKEDGNSWHFMRQTTALAFGENDAFATIGEDRTANTHDVAVDYMGPTLWSSDPAVFAVDFGRNGSHLDMLHASPYGMGIAHQRGNRYFVFNGQIGAIDGYDFQEPHEPGGEDHSDGTLVRYIEGELKREPYVPSHMDFLPDETTLLIADTGNRRVVALDTSSGRVAERLSTPDGQIADPRRIADAALNVVVAAGTLDKPSGLVVGSRSFAVGDAATGKIHQFTFDGKPLDTLDLELPPLALGGLELGPDGVIYYTRKDTNSVIKLAR